MEEQQDYDLVIVGGAMAGATLACALAGSGLRIALLDSRPFDLQPAALFAHEFDARVSAVTPASQEIFSRLGVWHAMCAQRVSPYTQMHVWEADGTASIDFAAADIHASELGHIVENSVIVRSLHQHLARQQEVELIGPATVKTLQLRPAQTSDEHSAVANAGGMAAYQSSGVAVDLDDGRRLTTRLLVAADGARSVVRSLAQFSTREWDYQHQAIVSTVRTQLPHQQRAIQRFMDEGVLALLPLYTPPGEDEQRYCSIVWSVAPEHAQTLMALSAPEFCTTLQRATENVLGAVQACAPRQSFPLTQRHATDYVKERVALIGDAAHSIHPLAGQGANLGLLDAWVLAQELRQALHRQEDFSSGRVLRRYQRRRKGHNLGMMATMEGFRRLFADQPPAVRWLRNAGMSAVHNTPVVKNLIMRQAMGLRALDKA